MRSPLASPATSTARTVVAACSTSITAFCVQAVVPSVWVWEVGVGGVLGGGCWCAWGGSGGRVGGVGGTAAR